MASKNYQEHCTGNYLVEGDLDVNGTVNLASVGLNLPASQVVVTDISSELATVGYGTSPVADTLVLRDTDGASTSNVSKSIFHTKMTGVGAIDGQGNYTGWNPATGDLPTTGQTVYINQPGVSLGGWEWQAFDSINAYVRTAMTLTSLGNLYVPANLRTNGIGAVNGQGNYMGWNPSTGGAPVSGQSVFINQRGGSAGGWEWQAFDGANAYERTAMILTQAGGLAVVDGMSALGYQSTIATGTAPLIVASTTKVTNLNADLLDGADWGTPAAIGTSVPAAGTFTSVIASSLYSISNLRTTGSNVAGQGNYVGWNPSTGPSPTSGQSVFSNQPGVSAGGWEWQSFNSSDVYQSTPLRLSAGGTLTSLLGMTASGFQSLVTTGTAPIVVNSTTKCVNLNVDLLDGNDWGTPAAIGTATPAAGTFTTLGSTTSNIGTANITTIICTTPIIHSFLMPIKGGAGGPGDINEWGVLSAQDTNLIDSDFYGNPMWTENTAWSTSSGQGSFTLGADRITNTSGLDLYVQFDYELFWQAGSGAKYQAWFTINDAAPRYGATNNNGVGLATPLYMKSGAVVRLGIGSYIKFFGYQDTGGIIYLQAQDSEPSEYCRFSIRAIN